MAEDRRRELIEDIIEGVAHGDVAEALPAFEIRRVDDGTVLEIDLGEPDRVYIVTVTDVERVD